MSWEENRKTGGYLAINEAERMTAYREFLVGILVILPIFFPTGVGAQGNKTQSAAQASKPTPPSETEISKFQAEVIKTMTAYRKSLEKLLAIYERDFKREVEEVQDRRELYEKGYISRLELEESQRKLASTEAKLKETEARIAETKIVITEALVREELLKHPRLGRGEYAETPALIRYNGAASWSLAEKARIEKFFADRFGRLLPISALGQTPVHDRMKFDHRNAIDVALHPDSLEGRELMAYLRKAGIPFMAFRGGVAGSATGAHIHIGRPSLRATAQGALSGFSLQ